MSITINQGDCKISIEMKSKDWTLDSKQLGVCDAQLVFSNASSKTTISIHGDDDVVGDGPAYWLASVLPGAKDVSAHACKALATSDENFIYKEPSDVREDVRKIKEGCKSTIEEYEGYLRTDDVHLFARYGTNDADWRDVDFVERSIDTGTETITQAMREANKLAEFRIIEVGEHAYINEAGEKCLDGSALTFQAIHVLPQTYKMSKSESNSATDEVCALDEAMAVGGEIFAKFDASFTDDILRVKKPVQAGYAKGNSCKLKEQAFFLLSYSELIGSDRSWTPANGIEGFQYEYWKRKHVLDDGENEALQMKTRAGGLVVCVSEGINYPTSFWWQRSPDVLSEKNYMYVTTGGYAGNSGSSNCELGVVLAFCM